MIVNKVSKTATAVWYALSGTRKRARLVLKSALVMVFAQSVSAAVLFSDDYSEFNHEDYIIDEGDWGVTSNGVLIKKATSGLGSINTGDAQWSNYTTSASLRTAEAGENWEVARLEVRVSGEGSYRAYVKRDGVLVFKSIVNGQGAVLFTASTTVDPLQWHTMSIALQGSSITVSVNGEVVQAINNTDHSAGGVTLSAHVKSVFDDLLVVGDDTPDQEVTGLNSFFMGHSFFIPVSALLPEQTEIAGLTEHSQQTYFSGGQTGTPDNLWLDPTNKANVQAILDGGGIEQLGMVVAYDQVIDSYVKWIDYALESNPLRSVFIAFPWATYPRDNLFPYDQYQDGHRNGLHPQIDSLRSLYPDLDIFCLPYGLTGYVLDDLWYAGDLPELSQHTGPEETSVRADDKGHGGTMLKKFSALMWLGSLYHVDLNEHDFETGYPNTNLKQMAMDLIDDHDPEYRATSTPTPTPTQLEMLVADVNAGFNNVAVEVIEWPSELHNQLGAMFEFAYLTRPVESTSGKLPLVIALHGGGANWWVKSLEERLEVSAEIDKKQGFDLAELAGKELIMLEPNTTADWTADELDTMLDYVLANFPDVDPDRVYVTGYSKGGSGTWVWLNESADRFAAAAIGGAAGSQIDDVTKLANLPLWLIVGSDDGPATGTQNMVNNLSAAGNVNVEFTVIEGGDHQAAGDAYFSSVELVDFLLGFELPSQD